MAATAVLLI